MASFTKMPPGIPTFFEAGDNFDMYNDNELFDETHERHTIFLLYIYLPFVSLFKKCNHNFKWQYATLISFIFAIML